MYGTPVVGPTILLKVGTFGTQTLHCLLWNGDASGSNQPPVLCRPQPRVTHWLLEQVARLERLSTLLGWVLYIKDRSHKSLMESIDSVTSRTMILSLKQTSIQKYLCRLSRAP